MNDQSWSAIILTGGKSTRFGSDKSTAKMGELTLLSRILSDLPPGMEILIVGPEIRDLVRDLKFVRENPPGGGPVAALDAGVKLIKTEFVAVIATDMPFAGRAISNLLSFLDAAKDGVIPLDAEGVDQTLCAIYRTASLRQALAKLGNPQGCSMRSLIALLDIRRVELPISLESTLLDIDTPEDMYQAIEKMGRESSEKNFYVEEGSEKMNEWIEEVKKELGLSININIESILDIARDAAHSVERKAAPVTTFLLGYAVAAGADVEVATEKIAELAKNWPKNQ